MKEKPSKLDQFAERLDEWFGIEKKSLAYAREQLRQDGFSVSCSRLSDWWARRQAKRQEDMLVAQIVSGRRQVREVERELSKGSAPELKTLIALHRVLILKLSTEGNADPSKLELVNRMMREVQKFARLEQLEAQNKMEERKLTLLEAKAKQAEEAEQVMASGLSAEEQAQRMRAIFKRE